MKTAHYGNSRFEQQRPAVYQSEGKTYCRHILERESIPALLRTDEPRMFTLPADSLEFEASLNRAIPNLEILAVERRRSIHATAQAKATQLGLPLNIKLSSDLAFFEKSEVRQCDLMWLDYCGPYSPGKFNAMETIFRRGWLRFAGDSNPIIATTMMEGMDLNLFKELVLAYARPPGVKHYRQLIRMHSIPVWINEIAHWYGCGIKVRSIVRYRDRVRSINSRTMLFFVLEVTPERRPDFSPWEAKATNLTTADLGRLFHVNN